MYPIGSRLHIRHTLYGYFYKIKCLLCLLKWSFMHKRGSFAVFIDTALYSHHIINHSFIYYSLFSPRFFFASRIKQTNIFFNNACMHICNIICVLFNIEINGFIHVVNVNFVVRITQVQTSTLHKCIHMYT